MYYYNFVLVGYILLNIYSLLCLSKWFILIYKSFFFIIIL
jgi:hypothetical protein